MTNSEEDLLRSERDDALLELDKCRAELAHVRAQLGVAKSDAEYRGRMLRHAMDFVRHWDSCTPQQRELTGCICGLTSLQSVREETARLDRVWAPFAKYSATPNQL